ncbi:hypothetical protein C8Q74DRAFT_1314011 [Fomes fomentarius]|nr:hypothetical protein C8Q74DRAFT_1314011 [Fomes fomentarius]
MSHKRQQSTSTLNSPLSAKGDGASVLTTLTAAPAEVTAAAEIIEKMKGSLSSLGKTLDSLGNQTVQMIQVGGEAQIAHQIGSLRKHMDAQEKKQDEQIIEIEGDWASFLPARILVDRFMRIYTGILKEVLEQDIIEHLTALIEGGIISEIDALVEEQVALQLPEYIPQELQDELRDQRKQLEEVQKALHNSESRRANATLRSHKLHERVHNLFNIHGEVSKDFPRTLGDMFSISADTAASLMKDYGLGEPTPSRERNINRIMQHCGIQYQLLTPVTSFRPPSAHTQI